MGAVFYLMRWVPRLANLLQKLFGARRAPLAGAPAVRRLKTYSAESGYVYQYFYEGRREARTGSARAGIEFVFRVSADRKTWMPISVVLATSTVQTWEQAHGRELSPAERYAVAKLALFQAFDERSAPAQLRDEVCVRNADIEGIVERLGL
jgi:hypothetical protein